MPTLRLAYATLYLIALIAVFVLWSQVGGQSHLDVMPWYLKLGFSAATAFAIVKTTAAAVSQEHAWNAQTLKWFGILLVLLMGCGLASYYCHIYLEDQPDDQVDTPTQQGRLISPAPLRHPAALPVRRSQVEDPASASGPRLQTAECRCAEWPGCGTVAPVHADWPG
jgi:hypothetical protein